MDKPARAGRFKSSPGHKMQNTTLLFLIKKTGDKISHVCLAMKKRRFGAGRWNGTGGKVEGSESVEDAVMRETQEEIGVVVKNFKKIAELNFTFPHKKEWNQVTHVYFCEEWEGEPIETEEMNPKWFEVDTLPFPQMWPDDIFWLPEVLRGRLVKGTFVFGEGDAVKEHKVEKILSF